MDCFRKSMKEMSPQIQQHKGAPSKINESKFIRGHNSLKPQTPRKKRP